MSKSNPYEELRKGAFEDEKNKIKFKIKYFFMKLIAGVSIFSLIGCYAVGNLGTSKKPNDITGDSTDNFVVANNNNANPKNDITSSEIIGEVVEDTIEGVSRIGDWFSNTIDNYKEKKDIENDLKRAKERTHLILGYLGIIRYDDYENMNILVDLNRIKQKRFIINDRKTLIEAWIIGETLNEINPECGNVYYKNIVYIPVNRSDNSIPLEYKFSSKEDFAKLLGIEVAEGENLTNKIDEAFKMMIHEINGCVFVTEQQMNNASNASIKNNSNPCKFKYRNDNNRETSLPELIRQLREEKDKQALHMRTKVLGKNHTRYC